MWLDIVVILNPKQLHKSSSCKHCLETWGKTWHGASAEWGRTALPLSLIYSAAPAEETVRSAYSVAFNLMTRSSNVKKNQLNSTFLVSILCWVSSYLMIQQKNVFYSKKMFLRNSTIPTSIAHHGRTCKI